MDSPETALRPLLFGDNQEFIYDSCLEEVSESGEIEELTIFFASRDGSQRFGLTVEHSDHDGFRGTSEDQELPPAIETESVDPKAIIDVLRLPTKQILAVAVEIGADADPTAPAA
jgi:hypothetical protein